MGGTGPVRPAKSRLDDHAKGGKASTAVVSIPLRGYTAKSKDVFFQFSRLSPSEEILPPPRGRGGKSAMREGKGYRGLYLLSNFTRSRTRFFSADPFNRERVSLKIVSDSTRIRLFVSLFFSRKIANCGQLTVKTAHGREVR